MKVPTGNYIPFNFKHLLKWDLIQSFQFSFCYRYERYHVHFPKLKSIPCKKVIHINKCVAKVCSVIVQAWYLALVGQLGIFSLQLEGTFGLFEGNVTFCWKISWGPKAVTIGMEILGFGNIRPDCVIGAAVRELKGRLYHMQTWTNLYFKVTTK